MDKRTIYFRADGNHQIGYGHFIRTLALAEMLKQDFKCVYVTRNPNPFQISEINRVCESYLILPDDNRHFSYFLEILKGDEIVVLDNYYFTTEYQKAIKNKGCNLVCIDDLYDKHFVADVVINHAEGVTPVDYSVERETLLLLGCEYALLRQPFLKEDANSITEKEFSFLVIMGGADPLSITSRIVDILLSVPLENKVAVVGKSPLQHNINVSYSNDLSASEIYQLMIKSEIGILPASSVALEACAARLPSICGYFVNNQAKAYKGFLRSGLVLGVEDLNTIKRDNLLTAIEELGKPSVRLNLICQQKETLDKKSGQRLVNVFKSI